MIEDATAGWLDEVLFVNGKSFASQVGFVAKGKLGLKVCGR